MNIYPNLTCRRSAAIDIFNRFRRSAQLQALYSKLTGKPVYLEEFSACAACRQEGRRRLGVQDIPVSKITGSVDRSRDFSYDFRPLKKHLAERWAGAYMLSSMNSWPPVKVYKVGDRYFVEDGHHRVSVARFLGMVDIQAEVWEYAVKPARVEGVKPACKGAATGRMEPLLPPC